MLPDPTVIAENLIDTINKHEGKIHAFTQYNPEQIRRDAAYLSAGPLTGMSVGVKDIVETEAYFTEYGSGIYKNNQSRADAACVTLLKQAGALVAGKTVTTEFAFFQPGPTVNPYDTARTPGGSSSGSAAAVACGMVDIGIASQTAASLTRPASYCGIVGFKPSYARYNAAGVKYLAPSFDALGVVTRDVTSAIKADNVLKGPKPASVELPLQKPKRIGFCKTPWWSQGDADMHQALQSAADLFAQHTSLEDVDLADFEEGADLHLTIMSYEAAQSLAWEYIAKREQISPQIAALIKAGQAITRQDYEEALAKAQNLRQKADILFEMYDVLLAPAAPGGAPLLEEGTGSPLFSRLWTLLYLPSLTLPGMVNKAGLPIGVQFLGRYGADEALLSYGLWAEQILPDRPLCSG